ncbi:DUF305 domain-containing protein [Lacibacterium aquatile]|uniref:DUF305 domain-containing protein n=1 Tax=Lacibacterium aquatile TaxID=1168082 RepID=A0ABW5DPV2_9PROT
MIRFSTAMLLVALSAGPALAQDHSHHPASPATAASTQGFQAANAKMHKDMDIAFSGDADVDFMRGMIAHHQGAIDMAKVQLQYGKDPIVRQLSADIIKAQESEIAMMRDWLAKKGK